MSLRRAASLFFACLALLPAALSVWCYSKHSYFPGQFDDAAHWIHTVHLSQFPWFNLISETYWNRASRPILFPVLGLPFFLITESVPAATMWLMSCLLGVFSLSCYGTLRRYCSPPLSLLIALSLSLLPVVFKSSLTYLAELAFLSVSSLAIYVFSSKKSPPSFIVGILIGLSLCLRPFEGAFFWCALATFAVCYGWTTKHAALRIGAVSISIAFTWYFPSLDLVSTWVRGALFDAHPGEGFQEKSLWGANLVHTLRHVAGIYTLPGIGLVLFSLYWKLRSSGDRPPLFPALFIGFLPFALTLLLPNRPTALQDRYFLAVTVFCLGYHAVWLAKRARAEPFLLAVIGLSLFQLVETVENRSQEFAAHSSAADSCRKLVEGAAGLLEPKESYRVLLAGNHGFQELPCSLAALLKGYEWKFETGWDPRMSPPSLTYSYDAVLTIAPNGKQELLSKEFHESAFAYGGLEERDFEFVADGIPYRATIRTFLGHVRSRELCARLLRESKGTLPPESKRILWVQTRLEGPCDKENFREGSGVEVVTPARARSLLPQYDAAILLKRQGEKDSELDSLTEELKHTVQGGIAKETTLSSHPLFQATLVHPLGPAHDRKFCADVIRDLTPILTEESSVLIVNDTGLPLGNCDNAIFSGRVADLSTRFPSNSAFLTFIHRFQGVLLLTNDEKSFFRSSRSALGEAELAKLKFIVNSEYAEPRRVSVKLGSKSQSAVYYRISRHPKKKRAARNTPARPLPDSADD